MYYTNCLMFRVGMGLWNGDSHSERVLRNCTFFGGGFQVSRNSSGPTPVSVHDCAFDGTTIATSDYWGSDPSLSDYDYNAYTNTSDPFSIGGSHDKMGVSFNWQSSWFGDYYLPSDSVLIDAGDVTADQMGLYHFTTQTNQTPEYNFQVDMGYHYVATDQYGIPLDYNYDGIPDYIEDANGNGLVDSGEIGWNLSGDNGLKVIITKPRDGSTLP